MVATRTPWVVVLRWDWVFLLFVITVAGFISQVCRVSSNLHKSTSDKDTSVLIEQMFLTMGLQREAAGRGSIYTQIVFAMILERIFFHTIPSVMSVLGSLLILTSALYISVSCLFIISVYKAMFIVFCFAGDESEGGRRLCPQ